MSKEENEKILLSKLNDLEKKVLYFLNIKLKTHLTGNEISQIIPSQINNFLTQQFVRHSIFYNIEQDDINDYYFSLKNSLDSDDSWSSLVKILEKYEGDNTKTFNTY